MNDCIGIKARWPGEPWWNISTEPDLTSANKMLIACFQAGAVDAYQFELETGVELACEIN